ncbi:MAG: tripartite tricarboxylate transporter TctB family protein [Granulosicoccus sp.]
MSSDSVEKDGKAGSLIISLMFIALGVLTLYDTTGYSDIDSKVFPRAAAIILIVASAIAALTTLYSRQGEEGFGRGSWWRRSVLIAALLLACFLMPRAGFLIACAIAFAGSLVAANHDAWRPASVFLYSLSGAIVVGGFYGLFKFGLNVPLP